MSRSGAADPPLRPLAARDARPRLRPDRPTKATTRLWRWSCDDLGGVLAIDLGLLRRSRRRRRIARVLADATMPGARLVSRRTGQLRAARLPPRRRGACGRTSGDRLPRRGDAARRRAAGDRLARAAPPGRGARRRRSRRWASAPGDRVAAFLPNMPAGGGRVPRLREPRRGLVDLLARHGAGSRCSTASARSSRRC